MRIYGPGSFFLSALLTLVVVPQAATAQSSPSLAGHPGHRFGSASPTAAALGRYGDIPVGLHTGLPSVGVPLFTLEGSTMSLPVSLSYHAAALRVADVPGWVGSGWSLDAGGVITRSMLGNADDLPYGYLQTAHYLYDETRWTSFDAATASNARESFLAGIEDGTIDTEPDRYFYNFAGHSGQILLAPNITNPPFTGAITSPRSALKINAGGASTPWIVRSEDGVLYTFGQMEETTITSQSFSESGPITSNTQTYISSWKLSSIESQGGGNEFTFTYVPQTLVSEGVLQQTHRYMVTGEGCGGKANILSSRSGQTTSEKVLRKITSDRMEAEFFTSLRSDAPHPTTQVPQHRRLDSVVVKSLPDGVVLRRFRFTYTTVGRPFLASVTEEGAGASAQARTHSFTYDLDNAVPDYTSLAQDHWGHYNGASNTVLYPASTYDALLNPVMLAGANRDASASFVTTGSLRRITYPTGGWTDFVFEPNDFLGTNAGNGFVKTQRSASVGATTEYDGWGTVNVYTFEVMGNHSRSDSVTQGTITWSMNPQPAVAGGIEADFQIQLKRNGLTIGIFSEVAPNGHGTAVLALKPGTYTLEAYVPAAQNPGGPSSYSASAYLGWEDWTPPSPSSLVGESGGGIRIREIRHFDGLGGTPLVRSYDYRLSSGTSAGLSSGVLVTRPAYGLTVYENESAGELGTTGGHINGCVMYVRTGSSRAELGTSQGSPVGYTEVTEVIGASGEGGRTRHRFSFTYDDNPDNTLPSSGSPYAGGIQGYDTPVSPRTSQSWRRGHLLERAVFDASGRTLTRTHNEMGFSPTDHPASHLYLRAFSYIPTRIDGARAYAVFDRYFVVSGWAFLKSETTTAY